MDYNSHKVGAISELKVLLFLAENGWEVYVPASGNTICDMIAVRGKEVLRVQVKTAYQAPRSLQINSARNKNSAMRSNGRAPISYSEEDTDIIIATHAGKFWGIPTQEVEGRQTMCLTEKYLIDKL